MGPDGLPQSAACPPHRGREKPDVSRDTKCVYISSEIHALLKHLSIELNTTMKALVEEFVWEGVQADAKEDPVIRQMLRYLPRSDSSPIPTAPRALGIEKDQILLLSQPLPGHQGQKKRGEDEKEDDPIGVTREHTGKVSLLDSIR